MTDVDYKAIWEAAEGNRKRLNSCKKHQFTERTPPYSLGEKFHCENCGGEMDALRAFEYANGYKAAGGDPNVIIPGFEPKV